ncbi:MAG: GspMb/PilO family protein [Candidatus Paceibacterota bacterium]|jgi:Tfp pilus assembly protein PilO
MNSRILPILAFLVAIGIFFAYIRPTWFGTIAATKAAILSDERALVAAGEYTAQQNELASKRSEINPADLKRLAIFLPDSVDNVGLILNLNALAARSGLSLSNIDVAEGQREEGVDGNVQQNGNIGTGTIDLSLSAVGTYAALQDFLRDVEKSERLLDVQDLVVKSSNTGVYNYQMTLRLYWLR